MRISPISIAALASACSPLASASLIAPEVELCNNGEYAVGLVARAGPWINSVAPVCARWDNDHLQSGPLRTAGFAGGPGGNPIRQLCPAGTAIWSWRVSAVSSKGQSVVWAISAQCKGLAPPHDFHPNILHLDAAGGLPAGPQVPEGKCQQGQLAVGTQVWSSVSQPAVIDIKMQCGRGPTVDMPMATTRNADGTITYFKPSFKLKSGDVLHVDWCQEWATHCGAPAADAFCRLNHAPKSTSFQTLANAGLTAVIATQKVCIGSTCNGFQTITCAAAP